MSSKTRIENMDVQSCLKLFYPKTAGKRKFKQVQLYLMDCCNKGQNESTNDIINHLKYSLLINDGTKEDLQKVSNQIKSKYFLIKQIILSAMKRINFEKKCTKSKWMSQEKRTKNILKQ